MYGLSSIPPSSDHEPPTSPLLPSVVLACGKNVVI